VAGTGEKGIDAALRATARLSFLLFWVAYAGSAMASLFGSPFQTLKLRAREFGLAFASAQLVHIGLVVWLCLIGAAPDVSTFVFFGIALVWVYLLALFSIGRLRRALGPGSWWILRDCLKVGGTNLRARGLPGERPDSRPSPRSKGRFYQAPPTLRQSQMFTATAATDDIFACLCESARPS